MEIWMVDQRLCRPPADRRNCVSSAQKKVRKMTADKTNTSGDEYFHHTPPLFPFMYVIIIGEV
jgi:hypothetical protein